jgi:hypothetical protein
MTAPLLAGWLYGLSHGAPYWISVVLIGVAAVTLAGSTRHATATEVAPLPA